MAESLSRSGWTSGRPPLSTPAHRKCVRRTTAGLPREPELPTPRARCARVLVIEVLVLGEAWLAPSSCGPKSDRHLLPACQRRGRPGGPSAGRAGNRKAMSCRPLRGSCLSMRRARRLGTGRCEGRRKGLLCNNGRRAGRRQNPGSRRIAKPRLAPPQLGQTVRLCDSVIRLSSS